MKTFLLIFVLAGAALVSGQAQPHDYRIVNDVGDAEVADIASRLGLRYEELGMGNNRLGSGRRAFYVSVPDAGNEWGPTPLAERRKQSLTLIYTSSRKRFPAAAIHNWNSVWSPHFSTAEAGSDGVSLSAKLFLIDGVTFRTVLEHVRRINDGIRTLEPGFAHH